MNTTVKLLFEECKKQIAKGNGDKVVIFSDDEEGNGFHMSPYVFSEDVEANFEACNALSYGIDAQHPENYIILG